MGNYEDVDVLDDLVFSTPQATHQQYDIASEVPQVDVQSQPNNDAKRRRTTKGHSKRTKKFSKEEDVAICSAWLNVGKDPIHGANQTRLTFWGRILAYFDEHKESEASRSENSIMHRWLDIQKDVNKFCGVYDSILRRNQSGVTIEDMIGQALEMYQEVDEKNKAFTLIHCWNRLKDEDKWKAKRAELAEAQNSVGNKTKKQKTSKDSTLVIVQATNNDGATEVADHNSEERKRPLGNKKAKEAQRRGGSDASLQALDMMWEKKEAMEKEKEKAKEARFMAFYELEKTSVEVEKQRSSVEEKKLANEDKRIAIEGKKAEADLIEEENKIMSVDKSSLDELQLEYYVMMQKRIITRRKENEF